jgi:hypothetical protein
MITRTWLLESMDKGKSRAVLCGADQYRVDLGMGIVDGDESE